MYGVAGCRDLSVHIVPGRSGSNHFGDGSVLTPCRIFLLSIASPKAPWLTKEADMDNFRHRVDDKMRGNIETL